MDNKNIPWLQKPIHPSLPAVTNEIILFTGIILLAIVTRFYDLGTRVMSHDESLHTYFSWLLYKGQGYQHNPMMHGPYQFHVIALSYFLFGVSDFTARIPSVFFSLATVWMVWYWRRYLGNWGMIVAAFLMVISPYMLFYGRYVRNESFVGFSGIVLLYAILRYLESAEKKYLYLITLATLLHFTAKETAFIYTAQALVFLGLLFLYRVTQSTWENHETRYKAFIILLAAGVLLLTIGVLAIKLKDGSSLLLSPTETAAPANPENALVEATGSESGISPSMILIGLGGLAFTIAGLLYFYLAYVSREVPHERSFDILLLLFTFTLPMLSAFGLDLLKKLNVSDVVIPTDAGSVAGLDSKSLLTMGIVLTLLFVISIAVGLLWNREWWKYFTVFWGLFTIFYTTIFTNVSGFFTGVAGSLGYWLVQQGVERGSQPRYFYWLIQIPTYEFLPAIGTVVAIALGLIKLFGQKQARVGIDTDEIEENNPDTEEPSKSAHSMVNSSFGVFFCLMIWWSISTIVAFTFAGEKMPWLTYHMAWPMILFTGWGIGQIIESVNNWGDEKGSLQRSLLALAVFVVFLLSAFNTIRSWYGSTPPFQGTELGQLQATSAFVLPFVILIASGVLLYYLMQRDLASIGIIFLSTIALATLPGLVMSGIKLYAASINPVSDTALLRVDQIDFTKTAATFLVAFIAWFILRAQVTDRRNSPLTALYALTIFSLLAIQTMRASFRAAYINYDNATEYLVYAHAATGVKDVLAQVTEISERTAGGLNAIIAYDNSAPDTGVSWPVVWYLRDFTALRSFDQPSRSLREAVAVIVDQKNFDKIEPALGDGFYRFDYIRMWWPNQDYFNLTADRLSNAVSNAAIREGIFDIWFNRDYYKYAQAIGSSNMTLTSWQPSDPMRLYVRKDVAAQIWNYGVGPSIAPSVADPYEAGTIALPADQIFDSVSYAPQGLNAPRAIAAGQNNDLYVADSRNHRILHIDENGTLLNEWGSYAAIDYASGLVTTTQALEQAPLGTFYEPWGVAVGPDGSVYVTDTWNHRIQKFTADGKPIKAWGQYGQPILDDPNTAASFWGPRGIAVNAEGRVFVADTGNKRIVVFDKDGNYITEFGTAGFDPGQFDEPVAMAIASSGTVFVTDTWNQRIQAFVPNGTGDFYIPIAQWDVNGWFGQSVDNKPFIAVDDQENVYITDPEGYRVIEFTSSGEFVRAWGAFGNAPEELGLASGIVVDRQGHVWVTDAGNNRILRYTVP